MEILDVNGNDAHTSHSAYYYRERHFRPRCDMTSATRSLPFFFLSSSYIIDNGSNRNASQGRHQTKGRIFLDGRDKEAMLADK